MGLLIYGTERIPGVTHVEITTRDQQAPPVRTNPETTRNDRQGLRQLKFSTFDKGFGIRRGTENSTDITRVRYSDGPWTHIPNGMFLPPVLASGDWGSDSSASRAANHSVHAVHTTIGQTKSRAYFFAPGSDTGEESRMLRTTSDSDPALTFANAWATEQVTAAAEVMLNNTRGILVAFNGATNDVKLITNPTATPPTESTAFTLSGGDQVDWISYKPNIGPGFVLMGGTIGGVVGIFYLPLDAALLTAPLPVVLTATKDILADAAEVTLTDLDPTTASNEGEGPPGGADDSSIIWRDVGNIFASDDADATWWLDADGASGQSIVGLTSWLHAGNFEQTGTVPLATRLTELIATIEHAEDDAANDAWLAEVQLLAQGSQQGQPRSAGDELGTADSTDTVGAAGDNWGTGENFTGAMIRGLGLRMRYAFSDAAANLEAIRVDHVRITSLKYRPTGSQARMPGGGNFAGDHPLEENSFYVEAPEFGAELTGRNTPRILWRIDVSYDGTGDRPTVELAKPSTFIGHVEATCIAQAAIVIAGANGAGTGKAVRRIGRDGVPEDMQFNTAQGYTESWNIVNLVGNDKCFWALVALDAGTTCQWWICVNGSWHTYSKRFTTTSLPLRLIGEGVDPTQRYSYVFAPQSPSDSRATRQFFPVNPLADPLVNNTSIVKENGVLTVQAPDLDALGPEEAIKDLHEAWFLGREVSSTNTVRLRYSIDGGANFTTWTTFTTPFAKATLSTPVVFRTVIFEWGLDHTAGSTGTPNGLAVLIEGSAIWPSLRKYRAYLNPADPQFREKYPTGIEGLWAALSALQATSPVTTLRPGNGASAHATWTRLQSAYNASADPVNQRGAVANPIDPIHYIEFDEVAG